ncbi:phosphoheptose isomerase [Candidatus Saccharibacteria bacterium]|nr:phosphoheptose isomerase [Candidatus Saccharibacteria bacterium]
MLVHEAEANDYEVVEVESAKPWGAYLRFNNQNANKFIAEFFPGLSPEDARLGNSEAELSPKILLVSPGQRLSWQYHDRRAERWTFLTDGAYCKSSTNEEVEPMVAVKGEVVQFKTGERHRLIGRENEYTLVAEIWQHTDPDTLSDENDIVRVQDDYRR